MPPDYSLTTKLAFEMQLQLTSMDSEIRTLNSERHDSTFYHALRGKKDILCSLPHNANERSKKTGDVKRIRRHILRWKLHHTISQMEFGFGYLA